jgi:hypothetical protein
MPNEALLIDQTETHRPSFAVQASTIVLKSALRLYPHGGEVVRQWRIQVAGLHTGRKSNNQCHSNCSRSALGDIQKKLLGRACELVSKINFK